MGYRTAAAATPAADGDAGNDNNDDDDPSDDAHPEEVDEGAVEPGDGGREEKEAALEWFDWGAEHREERAAARRVAVTAATAESNTYECLLREAIVLHRVPLHRLTGSPTTA